MEQLSLFTVDVPRKRSLVRPLDQPQPIFNILSRLPIGAEVPLQVRIYDYDDGTIPVWLVQEREAPSDVFQVLTLIDQATREVNVLGEQTAVAVEVFVSPGKILAAPYYLWMPGGAKRRDQLADIRQHARQLNERG